ncbi:hypothetical protein [Streptacidiphilus jiangxiensis]|uniref:Uncharacterized protein n=1 Tax=Streptacidiphilus jiangxiensis TaxID=235985 RepID=A0A1H7PAC5_STRJI|nr:hypothetical protein [Streptacidiphilus jiangxiensis]SEL32750.1 hypothetical protein SAMN05414137_107293 [Streptacidiphilus jiangxiensis]
MVELPESVDRDILGHRILPALTTIRETLGCSIPEALDTFNERYKVLRRNRPAEFTVGPDEYGRGFFS